MTNVLLGSFLTAMEPYAVAFITAAITAAITYIAKRAGSLIGIQITESHWQVVHSAALAAAQRIWAASEPSIATAKIDVRSPIVAAAAQAALDTIPQAAKSTGVTPDDLAMLVAAKLGGMQAHSASGQGVVIPLPKML